MVVRCIRRHRDSLSAPSVAELMVSVVTIDGCEKVVLATFKTGCERLLWDTGLTHYPT